MTGNLASRDGEAVRGSARQGYVICAEQRTGSTLLCHWLTSTGVLGRPTEYFERIGRAIALERDPSLIDALLADTATPNGVYGIKLFPYQFDVTAKAGWLSRLPEPHFIHLGRRDLLGQAISLVRASQTKQFHSYQTQRSVARYDGNAIRHQLARLAEADARWRRYFARNGLDVLWLLYEDMIRDPAGTVRAIATHIGVAVPTGTSIGQARVEVQRDELSEAWRSLFLDEFGNMNILDHRLGQPRVWVRRVVRDVGYWWRRLGDTIGSGGLRKPRIDHTKVD